MVTHHRSVESKPDIDKVVSQEDSDQSSTDAGTIATRKIIPDVMNPQALTPNMVLQMQRLYGNRITSQITQNARKTDEQNRASTPTNYPLFGLLQKPISQEQKTSTQPVIQRVYIIDGKPHYIIPPDVRDKILAQYGADVLKRLETYIGYQYTIYGRNWDEAIDNAVRNQHGQAPQNDPEPGATFPQEAHDATNRFRGNWAGNDEGINNRYSNPAERRTANVVFARIHVQTADGGRRTINVGPYVSGNPLDRRGKVNVPLYSEENLPPATAFSAANKKCSDPKAFDEIRAKIASLPEDEKLIRIDFFDEHNPCDVDHPNLQVLSNLYQIPIRLYVSASNRQGNVEDVANNQFDLQGAVYAWTYESVAASGKLAEKTGEVTTRLVQLWQLPINSIVDICDYGSSSKQLDIHHRLAPDKVIHKVLTGCTAFHGRLSEQLKIVGRLRKECRQLLADQAILPDVKLDRLPIHVHNVSEYLLELVNNANSCYRILLNAHICLSLTVTNLELISNLNDDDSKKAKSMLCLTEIRSLFRTIQPLCNQPLANLITILAHLDKSLLLIQERLPENHPK